MQKQTAILIGRFQPLHKGHKALLKQISNTFDDLIILIGSVNSTRTLKNPWSFKERKFTIEKYLDKVDIKNVTILPINDYPYNDSQWIVDVKNTVASVDNNPKVIVGFYKEGNDYLLWFKDFGFKDYNTGIDVNATSIREKMFFENDPEIPFSVLDDYIYFEKEKNLFSTYPFPKTLNFNCADCIVECNDHILLVKRKFSPGKGTYALPGGFKNNDETFFQCAIRELKEEVKLKVPEKVLKGCVVNKKLFDSPTRSMGIPRNTLVVHIKIEPNNDRSLPDVKGRSDTSLAKWVSLNDVMNSYKLFDDHQAIISKMLGVNPTPAYLNKIYF